MDNVLITGSNSGLGLELSLAFAEAGQRVFAGVRSIEKAETLVRSAKARGLPIEVVRIDVVDESSIKDAIGKIISRHDHLDVVVNNAGISGGLAIETTSEEIIREDRGR